MAEPIRYDVDLSARIQHLVQVGVNIPADLAAGGRIALSTWTPGSYVIRDYARHVQSVHAHDPAGREVALRQESAGSWRLPTSTPDAVTVRLELYANALSVRTNHVDDHHALLVAAATFPLVDGAEDRPHEVRLTGLQDLDRVWSLLPEADEPGVFVAADRDHLVDSAFEVGALTEATFTVGGVPHRFVWAGHGGEPDTDRLAADLTAVAERCRELFGGRLPVERYTFLALGWDEGGGGLEHRDGAVLQVPVHTFQEEDLYARLLALATHEYLHLWNAKRLVPAALVTPDYERPTYTESLWVAEGWTAYYDELLATRAQVWPATRLLEALQRVHDQVTRRPGVHRQTLRQASLEAWVKHYVPDENRPNAITDYYAHGSLVALELDLRLRAADPHGDGLDEVLRLLWRRHSGPEGYTEEDVLGAVSEVGGHGLAALVEHRVGVPGPPEVTGDLLAAVGLRWATADEPAPPELGVEVRETDAGVELASVLRDGPAWQAGATGGDRLLAIDARTVGRGRLDAVLRAHRPGRTVELTVVRGPRLLRLPVTLGAPHPAPRLQPLADPTPAQRSAFRRWCGQDLPSS